MIEAVPLAEHRRRRTTGIMVGVDGAVFGRADGDRLVTIARLLDGELEWREDWTPDEAEAIGLELVRVAGEQRAAQRERQRMAKLCDHAVTRRGADAPRRFGSSQTEVCTGCGAFRTHGHDAAKSNKSEWRPREEYAAATAPRSDDDD